MIILGLGSNIGDRENYLKSAIRELSEHSLKVIKLSPVYESKALVSEGADKEWASMLHLNMAIMLKPNHDITPYDLLKIIKDIEKKIGRKYRGFWGPREIDIDILTYDDLVVQDKDLTIPHKELYNRNFALFPLADIAPDFIYKGKTALEMCNLLSRESIKLWKKEL